MSSSTSTIRTGETSNTGRLLRYKEYKALIVLDKKRIRPNTILTAINTVSRNCEIINEENSNCIYFYFRKEGMSSYNWLNYFIDILEK